jgi:hypothetical protein
MRRRVLATLLVTVLLAGCSGTRGSTPRTTPSGGTPGVDAPTTGTPPAGGEPFTGTATGNAEQVCSAARRLGADQAAAFIGELGKALTAGGDGDQAAADRARRAAATAINRWSVGLRAEADRADDPRLGGLLDDMAAEVSTMTADVDSIDDARLDELQQRLDQLCGP